MHKASGATERGSALIVALAFLSILAMATTVFVSNLMSSSNFARGFEARTKALYIAEAGLTQALWKLEEQGEQFRGDPRVQFGGGWFSVTVEGVASDPRMRKIVSRARLDGNETSEQVVVAMVQIEGDQGNRTVTLLLWENSP